MKSLLSNENLFLAGCCFAGYSFFQMLGQLIRGFPESRNGAIAITMLCFIIVFFVGFANWCGLWYKTGGHLNKNQSIVGFAPFYVFGTIIFAASTIGMIAGG